MNSPALTLTVELGPRSYPIEITSGALAAALGPRLRAACPRARHAAVITDSNVAPLYAQPALESLRAAGLSASLFAIPAGETSKSLAVLSSIYDHLLENRLSRQDALVALGGGVVGDLAGFAAATILRGVDFAQIPTSLVAMVDSSVGGKTGVNHPLGKNLIGAFWQPRLVFVDTAALRTLPRAEFVAGMGEVIKHGVIRDAAYFEFLEESLDRILALEPAALARVVEGSCRIKAAIVAEDERETRGLRAILNFGHTIGHALEAVAGYGALRHGEAVAIGMEAAGWIALRRGRWTAAERERVSRLIERAGLPRRPPAGASREAILEAMALDKKVKDGRVRFVLPARIGHADHSFDVEAAEIHAALDLLSA